MKLFKQILFFGSLTVGLLMLTSCGLLGGSSEETATATAVLGSNSPEPLAGQAQIACSQACANQGQCGIASMEGSPAVVFLNNNGPNLDQHDALMGVGTAVNILNVQERTVAKVTNNQEQSQLRFYQVEVEGRAPAWVAGWCVQQ